MKNAPIGDTTSHPAVIATSPASAPFKVMETSGFLYLIQVIIITIAAAAAAAMLVVTKMFAAVSIEPSVIETVEPPLKPNQQNHSMNTPSAPSVRLCPGIALDLPDFEYFPIRGPSIFAPTSAATPPTICTAVEPAKS